MGVITIPPPGDQPRQHPGITWFFLILIGIIAIFGLLIAAYYLSSDDQRGVTVIRLEGTMVTGEVSDAEMIGSEVVGREIRDAADDPMVEAIVLRVNSPGGTLRQPRRSSAISTMQNQKSLLWSPWEIWGPRLHIT